MQPHVVKVTHKSSARWMSFVLLVSVATVSLAITLEVPQFVISNDELAMSLIAEGSISGEPSPHLVFVSEVLGQVIARLYTVLPGVGWFAVSLLVTNLISVLVVAWLIRATKFWVKILWVGVMVPILWLLTCFPNFTATAVLACTVGLSFGALAKPSSYSVLAAISLVILGAMWRWDALILAFLISLPLMTWAILLSDRARIRMLITTVVLLASIAVPSLANLALANSNDTHEEWAAFAHYNEARGNIQDTVRAQVTHDLVGSQIGWSETTQEVFRRFLNFDSPLFMEPVIQADALIPRMLTFQGGTPSNHLVAVIRGLSNYWAWILAWLLLATLAITWTSPRKTYRVSFFVLLTLTLGPLSAGFLVALVRFPEHIALSIVCAFGTQICLLFRILPSVDRSGSKSLQALSFGILVLIFATVLSTTSRGPVQLYSMSEQTVKQRQMILERLQGTKQQRIVAPGRYMGLFSIDPYRSSPQNVRRILPLFSGWQVFSPDWELQKAKMGIEVQVYESLLNREPLTQDEFGPVVLLADSQEAELIADFINENLEIAVGVRPAEVMSVAPQLSLWMFVDRTY